MHPVRRLRYIALIEGVSFLVLLGLAMPLKYIFGIPEAVKIVGWLHGVLFILVLVFLAQVMISFRWPILRGGLVVLAALVPFGPFLIDHRLKQYEVSSS